VRQYRIAWLYFPSGVLIMLADMSKSELSAYNVAFGLLAGGFLSLVLAIVRFRRVYNTKGQDRGYELS
jgi:hypothetical protein